MGLRMWMMMFLNISVNIILHLMLVINIVPRVILKITILTIDPVIEIAEGVRAVLDVMKTLVGSFDSYVSHITYVMTLAINGAMVARDRYTSKIIDQALQ